MTTEEKTSMYSALGVLTYLQDAIEKHKSEYGAAPTKIILGALEWRLTGLDVRDESYVNDVLLSCNQNVDSGVVIVRNGPLR
jgi:hypothetical protein